MPWSTYLPTMGPPPPPRPPCSHTHVHSPILPPKRFPISRGVRKDADPAPASEKQAHPLVNDKVARGGGCTRQPRCAQQTSYSRVQWFQTFLTPTATPHTPFASPAHGRELWELLQKPSCPRLDIAGPCGSEKDGPPGLARDRHLPSSLIPDGSFVP